MDSKRYILNNNIRSPGVAVRNPPLLVLLHGEGGNERELFELFLDVDDRFLIVSFRAPFVQHENKFIWYSTSRYQSDFLANSAHLEYSRQHIIGDVKKIINQHGCNPDQVYYFGFGQGGVLALNVFLTLPDIMTGMIVLNSYFLPELRPKLATIKPLHDKSILLCHGIFNQIIPIDDGRKLRYELSVLPVAIDYQEFEIGHYYSKECNTYIKNWLSSHLNAARVQEEPEKPDYSTKLIAYQINVRDIDRSIDFYIKYLGMSLVERTGKAFAFISNSDLHHVIELQLSDSSTEYRDETSLGYHSIQYEVPDKLSFAKAYLNLIKAGITVSLIDKIICWQMKFPDPDGNIINIIWDTRHLPGRSDVWHGRELPLEREQILEVLHMSQNHNSGR